MISSPVDVACSRSNREPVGYRLARLCRLSDGECAWPGRWRVNHDAVCAGCTGVEGILGIGGGAVDGVARPGNSGDREGDWAVSFLDDPVPGPLADRGGGPGGRGGALWGGERGCPAVHRGRQRGRGGGG